MFHIEPEIGSRHLYAVHRSSSRQASLELIPGQIWIPGFDVSCTLSTPHQWFTCVRLPISHLTRSCPAFSVMLTTLALNQRSLRWFETCSCKPISEGLPPSSMQLRTKTIVLLFIAFCAHGTPDPGVRFSRTGLLSYAHSRRGYIVPHGCFRQEGWLVDPQPYIVRREWPLTNSHNCHPLPHVIGPTVSECRVGGGAGSRLTSVRRSNWTCGFPASSFHKAVLVTGSKKVLNESGSQDPAHRIIWRAEAISSHNFAIACGDVTITSSQSNDQAG